MQKIRFLNVLAFVLLSSLCYGQWKSSDIPDSLKKNADAVIRRYATDIRVFGFDKLIMTENVVITVLNEKGKKFADFKQYYDNGSKVDFTKGVIYDDQGRVVKKIRTKDLRDVSIMPDYTLYSDYREVSYDIPASSYPFTFEYEYVFNANDVLYIPTWTPQVDYRIGLQDAYLRVTTSDSASVRHKSLKITSPIKQWNVDGDYEQQWEIANLKPVGEEVFSPKEQVLFPSVLLAPVQFGYDGRYSSSSTWQKYGEWMSRLLAGRSDLSTSAVEEVRRLVLNKNDEKEKVRLVYKYLQSHTRYVSIQVGIGGWQPFPASSVEKNGYGDCKALVNYAQALLAAVGIESYYCEIGVDNKGIRFDDFPSLDQTNHIILCVPLQRDTVWLECTNQNLPFGYLVKEELNKKVLMIKDNRGFLVNTPRLLSYKNIQARRVDMNLDSVGNAAGTMFTEELGTELENLIPEIWSSRKDQAEIIQRKYRIPGIVFNGFEYYVDDESEPKAGEKVIFKVNGFASQTGRRLFIPFNPCASIGVIPSKSRNRVADVEVVDCFTHFDTIIYTIPSGFKVEFFPKPKTMSGLFGSYNSSVTVDGDKLITIRRYQQNRGRYPAKEFNNYVDFLLEISKQDKQTIVLVHK